MAHKQNPAPWQVGRHRKTALARYGLKPHDADRMRAEQGDACAICGKAFGKKVPHVEHDHATKKVRALLCARCNLGLGYIEQEGFVSAALAYLKKFAIDISVTG